MKQVLKWLMTKSNLVTFGQEAAAKLIRHTCTTFVLLLVLVTQLLWGAEKKQLPENAVLFFKVKGVINAGTARFIERSIDLAQSSNAVLVVMMLDTPGGLLISTRQVVQKINQSKVPVAVFVYPGGGSATSAGTIITMSAHIAAMAPGTNIGAAHPVGGQGEDIKGKMEEKATNDTIAFIKSQASLRNRNVEWAEQAILKSASATADEALKLNIIDFIASDLDSFLNKVDPKKAKVKGVPTYEIEMTVAERFLSFLGDPNISYLLMVLGGLGLYVELTSPGVVLPGVLGAIALILSFVSLSTLPVNYGAVALLFLGLVFFLAEAFVASYGVLTIGGIVSLVLGALFLMDSSTGDLRLSLALVIPTIAALSVISLLIGYMLMRSRTSVYQGLTNFMGLEATIQSLDAAQTSGKCLCRGEVWDFQSTEPLDISDQVRVIERKDLKLVVKPLKKRKV